jgi:hypothetical protein
MQVTDKRLPETLQAGFLGAGVTNFMNSVIAAAGEPKCAVILNEPRKAALDHNLDQGVVPSASLWDLGGIGRDVYAQKISFVAEANDLTRPL